MRANNGQLYMKGADGAWTEIGPLTGFVAADDSATTAAVFEFDGPALTGTATGVIYDDFWKKLRRLLGYRDGHGRLRRHKHGGGLPSFRDVRAKYAGRRYGP